MLVGLLHEVEGPIMLVGFHIEDFIFSFFFLGTACQLNSTLVVRLK